MMLVGAEVVPGPGDGLILGHLRGAAGANRIVSATSSPSSRSASSTRWPAPGFELAVAEQVPLALARALVDHQIRAAAGGNARLHSRGPITEYGNARPDAAPFGPSNKGPAVFRFPSF